MLKNYLMVFFVSMVPVIELRGAIPIGLGMGLPALPTYLVCVLGNMLPVPFIYLFARKFLIWGYHKPVIGPVCTVCIELGYADRALGLFSLTVGIAFAFIAARYHRYEQQQRQWDNCIIPFHSLWVLNVSFTSFFPTSSVTCAPLIIGTFIVTCPTGNPKHIG